MVAGNFLENAQAAAIFDKAEDAGEILPIEVKSGKDFKTHAALSNVLGNKEHALRHAIVFNNGNVEESGAILYAPVYMAMFLRTSTLPEKMIYRL